MRKHLLLFAAVLCSLFSTAQFNSANDYYYRGVALFEHNNYNLAITSFDSAVVMQPDFNDALNYRAISSYSLGMYDNAIADYNLILSNDPGYYSAYVNMANAYMGLNNFQRATELLNQARTLNPTGYDALLSMGNVHFGQGLYSDAKGFYQSMLLFDPQSDAASNNLGTTYFRLGMYDSAAYYHQLALKLKPNAPDYMFNLALDYSVVNNPTLHQESMNISQKILSIDPNNARANAQIAYLLMENQGYDPQLVLPYLNKAVAFQPAGSWYGYDYRGNLYAGMGMYDSAMNDYNRAIETFPGNVSAYTGRANLYRDSGMYKEAMLDYMRATYLNPGDDYPYLTIGEIMLRMGYFSAADSFYNSYYEHSENKTLANRNTYNSKSFALLNSGNYKEALISAKMSLSYDPDFAYALNNLGMTYAKLGRTDSALYYINRSLDKDRFNSFAYHNRAYVYAATGKTELACNDLQRAVQMHYPLQADSLLQKLAPVCKVKLPVFPVRKKPALQEIFAEISREESKLNAYKNLLNQHHSYFNIQNVAMHSFQYSNNYSLLLYPNPAIDKLNIRLNQFPRDPFSLLVFNNMGRIVKSNLNLEQSETGIGMDVSDLPSDRYVVMLLSRNTLLAKSLLWISR